MWTKILIFMIIFFLVASPAMFKIVRKLLGAWVASADGLATPAGLALHGGVLVLLALYLPRVLMTYEEAKKTEEAEEYEGEEEYEEAMYEGYASVEDRVAALEGSVPASKLEAAQKRLRRCPKCPKCRSKRSKAAPPPASPSPAAMATGSAPPVTVATTSGSNPQAILAPGAVAAASPTPVVITPPAPSGATSPYFEWNY
jgi:hypothetical protein